MSKNKKPKILYFSRGRGFCHAMRDMLIIEEFTKLNENLNIQVASYAEGYTCFTQNGFEVFDLGLKLNEEIGYNAVNRIESLIKRFKPALIVTDEGFVVLSLAKKFGIPSLLITNWFFESIDKRHPLIPVVRDANHIIFADRKEFHKVPSNFDVPVSFVGPIIRQFEYTHKDKGKARSELGLEDDEIVILVTPAGRHKHRNKLLDLTPSIIERVKKLELRLILLTGPLFEEYSKKIEKNDRVIVKSYDWKIDRLMAASDLVINKGTFTTTWELVFLGVPSISIPDGDNPVDLIHVKKLEKLNATVAINPYDFYTSILLEKIERLLDSEEKRKEMSRSCLNLVVERGQKKAAKIINEYVSNL